jgi:hypothetical protein
MLTRTFASVVILLALSHSVAAAEEKRLDFSVPAAPWNLTLAEGGFVVMDRQVKPDGRYGYFYMTDKERGVNLSFFIEPVDKCTDSKSCRDMVRKLGNPSWEKPQKFAEGEIEGASYFEFFMPSFRGMPVKQQNMYVEFVRDGFWVDMHFSKVLYKPEEHALFEEIIKSVRFEPKAGSEQKPE